MTDDLVKLHLRFHPGPDLPGSEGLWARPVDAHEGGGTYALENSSFMVPLGVGDVVRAELDGDGVLQVVDVVEPADALLTVFVVDHDAPPGTGEQLADRWSAAGASWTEGNRGFLVTTWPGLEVADVAALLQQEEAAGLGEWLAAAAPQERVRAVHEEVDFELDRTQHQPVVETSYWAPDDPYWAERGLDDPEFLAFVQSLAGDDERVARALERGQHERVMTFIERITAADPGRLPPLDGPIFDED